VMPDGLGGVAWFKWVGWVAWVRPGACSRFSDTLLDWLARVQGVVMRIEILAVAIAGLVAIGAFRAGPRAQASAPSQAAGSRSVWSGVFTQAQDKRGAAIYNRECSTCHGETLKGGEGAPALTGSEFNATWNGQTLGDLFDRIRQTMPAPPEQPGKLTPQQNADVVAHILSVNGFPAGPTELPADSDPLKQIRIEASKP
jgi:S-disulfanyl-L-cysteine oxidoreductase SoxD